MTPNTRIRCCTTASWSSGGGGLWMIARSAFQRPNAILRSGLPLFDMIEVRLSTRAGYCAAITCPIMPPIDAPTTCTRSMPSASSNPIVSAAMSSSVYGALTGRRRNARQIALSTFGTGISTNRVEPPASRLSKVTTR